MFSNQTLTRRITGGVGVLGLLVLSSACGGGDEKADGDSGDSSDFTAMSAKEIADASTAALKKLDTLHFAGAISSGGQDITLDIQLNTAGDCKGSFGTGEASAEILSVDGKTWFRPDEAFWKMSAGAAADQVIAAVGDKYVTVDPGDDSFSDFCDLDSLLDDSDDAKDAFAKGKTSEIDGEEVIAINRTDEKDGDSIGYVRTSGEHYLVKLEKTGDDAGTIAFDEFDEKLDVTAPGADEQITQAELGG